MSKISRRKMLGGLAGVPVAAKALGQAPGQAPPRGGVNRNSAPSKLRITDMRACTVAANYDYPLIRIDTNQGVYGLGKCATRASKASP